MAGRPVCRWAALSLSSIAATFLPDLLGRSDAEYEHKLVAVSTTGSKERAQGWLRDNKIPNADDVEIFHSWAGMLEENRDLYDAVYISTPHPLHYEHVKKALQCKRHTLVEKPATMTAEQYRRCCELARQNNVVLMEAMWTRYLPATQYFKDQLLPKIGEVKRVYSEFSFPIVSAELPHSSRFLDKKAGAGSLLDQGVYALTWVDLALNGIDSSAETHVVHASSIPVPGVPGEIDDIDTIVLAKRGATAIVTTSMTLTGSSKPAFYTRLQAKKPAPAVRIEGTKASVSIPFPPIRPEELHVQWYGEEYLNEDGTEKDEVIRKPAAGWGIWYQADVFAKAVLGGRQAGVIGEAESLRVLGWMDEARKMAGIEYDPEVEKP